MKKVYFLLLTAFSTSIALSQTLDEINETMGKKDYRTAKTGIDKYLSDAGNASKADGWYYKGRIYNSLSSEKTTPEAEAYDLKVNSFEAFKKYQQLDPKDLRTKLENYASYLDLYYGLYDLGANEFNKKNYADAFNSFKKALEVEDYIQKNKYTYQGVTMAALDTPLVMNTAIAATQAKKDDEAIPYYRKIVDANVAGESYKDIYFVLLDYYKKKSDDASANEILAMAKKNYPKDESWAQMEIDDVAKKGDDAALFAKYEEILAKDPGNFTQTYNYAVVLYKSIYERDGKQKDNPVTIEKLTNALKSAIALDPGIEATTLMANHQYNMAADYETKELSVKGSKPEDLKRKADFKAQKVKKADDCIIYSEKAATYFAAKTDLKATQIANYKIVLGYLSDMYSLKGDKKKADEYTKRLATIK